MHLHLEPLVRYDEGKPVVRPLADSGHSRVLLVCLRKGQILRDHKSASQVIAHVVKGNGLFVIDGSASPAAPGSVFLVEPNRFHRIHAVEDLVLLVVMAPHPSGDRYPEAERDRIVPHVETAP